MNLVVMLRTRFQRLVSRPSAYVSAEWERMPARERRWVTGLAITIMALTLGLGIFLVFSTISDLQQGGADIREALSAINKNRDDYLEAKARAAAQEVRLGTEPPQLVADIEAAAREESVQIAESNERPAVAAGKRWLQHDVDIKIRGVDLQALTKFLKRVETGRRPIFCTRLYLKRRFSEADKLDAEVTAVAFERTAKVLDGGAAAKKKFDQKDKLPSRGQGEGPGQGQSRETKDSKSAGKPSASGRELP
jgi:type II secretory pathway component PulM